MDLRREKDLEQLRRVALAQQVQIEQLLRLVQSQANELGALKGNDQELQEKLALLEEMARKAQHDAKAAEETSPSSETTRRKDRKARTAFGNTEQPSLAVIEQVFELDGADRTCPSCGGLLAPMKGQFEASEMIDVIEVSYRVVKVQQQKYACKCGGCIETAPGPERATPGGRYSLDFAIKVATDKYLDHIPLARRPCGTSCTRSGGGSKRRHARSSRASSPSRSSGSTRRAGNDSMGRARSPGRYGA